MTYRAARAGAVRACAGRSTAAGASGGGASAITHDDKDLEKIGGRVVLSMVLGWICGECCVDVRWKNRVGNASPQGRKGLLKAKQAGKKGESEQLTPYFSLGNAVSEVANDIPRQKCLAEGTVG